MVIPFGQENLDAHGWIPVKGTQKQSRLENASFTANECIELDLTESGFHVKRVNVYINLSPRKFTARR